MNEELVKIVKVFSTESHERFNRCLSNRSRAFLIKMITELLTEYISDKNSSTLRELTTVLLAGYEHAGSKLGYNGYRHEKGSKGKRIACEAKPKNTISKSKSRTKRKLNGYGNFSDYTYKRLKKDLDKNLHMLTSGFIDGKLLYLLEFPFKTKKFTEHIKEQLKNRFPDGDKPGEYLRSASFDYRHYVKENKTRIVFLASKKELEKHKEYFNQKFFNILTSKLNKNEASK